jgi:two-component system LytT family response regulator
VLRTIIIDDEAPMRQSLEMMLKVSCPNIKVIATADSVKNGVLAIKRFRPDLVFLDIKMSDGTGFDLLRQLEPIEFKVIFITAYDQYAVKAFKFSAMDYLLKPLDQDELKGAVNKAEKSILLGLKIQLEALQSNMRPDDYSVRKIILRTFDSIHLVITREIICCESDGSYTIFHLVNGNSIVVSNRLKEYDEILTGIGFFRAHKSFLINLSHIIRFDKGDGGYVILTNEIKIPVASRKKEQLMELFDKISW